MTEEPDDPGGGPRRNQPASAGSWGTSTVPSGRCPSRMRCVFTSMAGMLSASGSAGGAAASAATATAGVSVPEEDGSAEASSWDVGLELAPHITRQNVAATPSTAATHRHSSWLRGSGGGGCLSRTRQGHATTRAPHRGRTGPDDTDQRTEQPDLGVVTVNRQLAGLRVAGRDDGRRGLVPVGVPRAGAGVGTATAATPPLLPDPDPEPEPPFRRHQPLPPGVGVPVAVDDGDRRSAWASW